MPTTTVSIKDRITKLFYSQSRWATWRTSIISLTTKRCLAVESSFKVISWWNNLIIRIAQVTMMPILLISNSLRGSRQVGGSFIITAKPTCIACKTSRIIQLGVKAKAITSEIPAWMQSSRGIRATTSPLVLTASKESLVVLRLIFTSHHSLPHCLLKSCNSSGCRSCPAQTWLDIYSSKIRTSKKVRRTTITEWDPTRWSSAPTVRITKPIHIAECSHSSNLRWCPLAFSQEKEISYQVSLLSFRTLTMYPIRLLKILNNTSKFVTWRPKDQTEQRVSHHTICSTHMSTIHNSTIRSAMIAPMTSIHRSRPHNRLQLHSWMGSKVTMQ